MHYLAQVSHYGVSREAQDHAQQTLQASVNGPLEALSNGPLYDLSADLPAPFRPPLESEGMKQFFKLSFLNAFTQASAFKAMEPESESSLAKNGRLRYLGQKDEYYFYEAPGSLVTDSRLRLPIDRGTVFVSIGCPLRTDELPSHAFLLKKDGRIEKFYFGDLESRFYEVSFINSPQTVAGVNSWFIESSHHGSYFNTRTLSTVLEEDS